MIVIRKPDEIYQAHGRIENGTFHGRWHFSFGENYDPENIHFGTLRVFNDDTLSPGAVWPLHHHTKNEVVTYCVEGEFRHEDQNGKGGILKKGWVQHTTIGTGMYHSEININPNKPMRFIQMWFFPEKLGLKPAVEQKRVEKKDRANKFLPIVSNEHNDTLSIRSDAIVCSSFIENGKTIPYSIKKDWGVYLYVLEGGPIEIDGKKMIELSAAKIKEKEHISVKSMGDSELLLVHVSLNAKYINK